MAQLTRRRFIVKALGFGAFPNSLALNAAVSLHCTPAPEFSVPLTEGVWRSQEFPVGKHAYNVYLNVDRRVPLDELDCDLGPPHPGHHCDTPPLLDLTWRIWDGTAWVKNWSAVPIQADAWAESQTSCVLGGFEGTRNGRFILELNVKKDVGRLKDLHPRIEIVKNPGYWCLL